MIKIAVDGGNDDAAIHQIKRERQRNCKKGRKHFKMIRTGAVEGEVMTS